MRWRQKEAPAEHLHDFLAGVQIGNPADRRTRIEPLPEAESPEELILSRFKSTIKRCGFISRSLTTNTAHSRSTENCATVCPSVWGKQNLRACCKRSVGGGV